MTDVDTRSLDEVYFEWLYGLVASVENRDPSQGYWRLLAQFYVTTFYGYVPNDDNRSADGKDLRIEFLQSTGYPLDDPYGTWFDVNCSMFEMLVALARRVSFEDEAQGSAIEWFWRLIGNLELEKHTDLVFDTSMTKEVEEILERINKRTYLANGSGGLFPLRRATQDQRNVELWTQMSTYLLEGTYAGNRPSW